MTCITSPIVPSSISSLAMLYHASQRLAQLTARTMPASRQDSTMASASSRLMEMGFSAQIAFTPTSMAAMVVTMSARGRADVQMETMSGRSLSSISL